MAVAQAKFLVTSLPDDKYTGYLCDKIGEIATEAISSRGVFLLGVSGGSVVDFLAEGLPKIKADWGSWKIFLCDERLVPDYDPESTFGLYQTKLLPKLVGFPEENFVQVDKTLPGKEAGQDYEEKLKNLWANISESSPSFGMADCLILGVGPDGHTCSLFPDHRTLNVVDTWVTYVKDSPKPPPERVTLTFPFINKASHIFIAGKGKQKWDILENVKNDEDLPIGRVDNSGGHLEWILNSI